MSGLGVNPGSDGTTQMIERENTKPVFDKHQGILYPKSLKKFEEPKALEQELEGKYSMLQGIPKISNYQQEKAFTKIKDLQYENTYETIVARDITKMNLTVRDEIKDTLGLPRPHRKV